MRQTCFNNGRACPMDIIPDLTAVFVGMPFKDASDPAYTEGIGPALRQAGLTPWRADEQPGTAGLLCKICQGMQAAGFAVLDLTGNNSNVLFELGLLLGLGKRAILARQGKGRLPSDLRGMEILVYHSPADLREQLGECLLPLLQTLRDESVHLLSSVLRPVPAGTPESGEPVTCRTDAVRVSSETRWTNLPEGLHLITYELVRPDGQRQPITDNSILFSVGALTEIITAVYDIAVRDNPPSLFPGPWQVNIALDEVLLDTKKFTVQA